MNKYLVVGGAGYIGTHVVQALRDAGHQVVVFDNYSSNIDHQVPGAKYDEIDICNEEMLCDAIGSYSPFDCVFHFAAYKDAGASMKPLGVGSFAVNNIAGTINLLNSMLYHDIRNIVFSSSAAVYGTPQYTAIREGHPTIPTNFYGETKLIVERLLEWYSKIERFNYAALRYFNAAGYDLSGRIRGKERSPSNLLPIVMETAAGVRDRVDVYGDDYNTFDGTGVRDYIHVDDLTSAHILAADHIVNKKEDLVVNLGTGGGYSVLTIVDIARDITGKPIPHKVVNRRDGDVATVIASAEKAYNVLGWKAKHSDLETILTSMWNVYKG